MMRFEERYDFAKAVNAPLRVAANQKHACVTVFFCLFLAFNPSRVQAQISPLLVPIRIPVPLDVADPLPIRRVFVPLERVSAELERAGAKKLIHLSQEEFEAKIGAARAALEATRERPRLVEAHYQASLMGTALVGEANWKLTHASKFPGVLPLRPMNLALRQASLDGGPAILGDLEPRSLGLLVETPGPHNLALDWSVRGESDPVGLRFDLRFPACVLTSLELDLPAGRLLSSPREQCLITGPMPGSSPGRERWVLEILNRSRLGLVVRTPDRQDRGAPLLVARVEERQNLSLDQVECIHDFAIDVSRGAMRELDLSCSAGLQPIGVVWRNSDLEDWRLLPPEPGQQERRLHIRLPEALQSGSASLRVRAVATGPLNQPWSSPELRLQNAVVLSETLTFQVAPDLELADWHPGRFDLMKATNDASGCYLLHLQAGPFDASKQPQAGAGRPRARPRLRTAQATARLQLWWDIGPSGERLTARARLEPRGAPLFRLQCRIPTGWRIERIDLLPAGLLADWTILASDKNSSLVIIHSKEAIESSQPVTVFLTLSRSLLSLEGSEQSLALPSIDFPQALAQVCSLGVSVASQLRVKSAPAGIVRQPAESSNSPSEFAENPANAEKPLWENHALWGLAHFHGLPPAGRLVVEGLIPRIKMHSTCRVDLSLDQPAVGMQMEIEPIAGAPQSFDVHFSAPIPAGWKWTEADGRSLAVRPVPAWESLCLPGIGPGPFQRINVLALALARPQVWRFTLSEPLTRRRIIEKAPETAPSLTFGPIPLPVQVGDVPVAGEVELLGAEAGRKTVETQGLAEGPAPVTSAYHPDFSRLHYERSPVSLSIHAPSALAKLSKEARVEDVTIAAFVERSGPLREQLTCRLHSPAGPVFSLEIPEGARVLSVRVDGRWADVSFAHSEGAGQTLNVPTPAGRAQLAVEVNWERDAPAWCLWNRIQGSVPKFPGPAPNIRRVWSLAPGLAPANLENLQPLPGFAGSLDSRGLDAWLTARMTANSDRTQVQHLVAEAEVQFRGLANETVTATLGNRLNLLVSELAKGQLGLVIDAAALRAVGLNAGSRAAELKPSGPGSSARSKLTLTASFLQPFDLELLSTSPVPLLTTRRAKVLMGAAESSPVTKQALLQAVRLGRDASGRYENAVVWLADAGCASAVSSLLSGQVQPFPGWPCWQVQGNAANADTLLVVRQDYLYWAGYAILAALVVFGWRIHNRRRTLFALACAIFLGLLTFGLILPPHLFGTVVGPSIAGLVVCLALLILLRLPPRTMATAAANVPMAFMALALLAAMPGRAAAPGDFTVLLLSEEAGKKIGVLAPTELLDALNALVDHSKQPLDRPVLLEARYQATASEGAVECDADFVVYCPSKGPTDYMLSLGSVELREALCDLQPAFPMAAPAGQTGYVVRLSGAGRHRLRLRFAAPTIIVGPERDCRIAIPSTVCAHLDFRAPQGSRRLQAVLAAGSQQVTPEAGGVRLLADLGRIPTLQIRWRAAETKEERPVLEVKELYLWDLQTARRLLGVLRYQVVRGSETALFIDVPAEWDVRQVEIASLSGSGANRLRDWGIVPGPQSSRLRLEFQFPLTTSVQVFVELLSRKPATTQPVLALPTPVGAASSGGILAYHLGLREAALTESLGFTGVDLKSFAAQWQSAGVEDPGSLGRAFSFRRSAGAPLSMHLDLKPLIRFTASQAFAWRARPNELAGEATLHLEGREEDLTLVEWDLPASLQMEEVLGADVNLWSVTNQHVQVWLNPGVNKSTISWRAWSPSTRPLGEPWAIPVTHLAHATEIETSIRVEAEPGWSVAAGKLANLRSLPAPSGTLSLSADQPQYGGEIVLHEAPLNPAKKVGEKSPAQAEQPSAAKRGAIYLTLEEQSAFLGPDNHWEHGANYFLLAGIGQVVLFPPENAAFTAAFLDGQEVPLGTSAMLTVRLEGTLRRRQLRVCWRWPPGQERARQPDLGKPRLENVAMLPGTPVDEGLWEIVTPPAVSVKAAESSARAVSPPLRLVRRAAGALCEAQFLASAEREGFRESEARFRRNVEAATDWLAQASDLQGNPEDASELETRLRQLETANRLLSQNAQGPNALGSPQSSANQSLTDKSNAAVADREQADNGIARTPGISSFWQAANAASQPNVVLSAPSNGWLDYWMRWSLTAAFGCLMFFLVGPSISETRRSGWRPEMAALLGAFAGFLAGSWLLALGVLCSSVIWRLVLIVMATSRETVENEPLIPT
ncbi:MAG TPA: hypothetical protein VGP68_20185 [Gemmataceae bacterium]|nr:hypothetical protein [Gemmataceae bacterium]